MIKLKSLLKKNVPTMLKENELIWCAVILDDRSKNILKKEFPNYYPDGWTEKTHHMTINPFKPLDNQLDSGKDINLMVSYVGFSNQATAVKVVGYKGQTYNNFPHITLAVNELDGGKSKDSNYIKNWKPVTKHIILSGTIKNIKS